MSAAFSLVRASVDDGPRLTQLLEANFGPYEPLHHAFDALDGEEDPSDEEDEYEFAIKDLSQGYSLLALEGDDLVGAAFNREITSNEYNLRAEMLASAQSEGLKMFFKFWAHVEREAGFWEEGGPDKALELHVLVVSAAARGRGLGKALVEASRDVAREAGYRLFRIDCSSYYSARIAESAGMTCVYSLPYVDYKNESGETVLAVAEPHKEFKIFKQQL